MLLSLSLTADGTMEHPALASVKRLSQTARMAETRLQTLDPRSRQNLVEYALLLACIALAATIGMQALGGGG